MVQQNLTVQLTRHKLHTGRNPATDLHETTIIMALDKRELLICLTAIFLLNEVITVTSTETNPSTPGEVKSGETNPRTPGEGSHHGRFTLASTGYSTKLSDRGAMVEREFGMKTYELSEMEPFEESQMKTDGESPVNTATESEMKTDGKSPVYSATESEMKTDGESPVQTGKESQIEEKISSHQNGQQDSVDSMITGRIINMKLVNDTATQDTSNDTDTEIQSLLVRVVKGPTNVMAKEGPTNAMAKNLRDVINYMHLKIHHTVENETNARYTLKEEIRNASTSKRNDDNSNALSTMLKRSGMADHDIVNDGKIPVHISESDKHQSATLKRYSHLTDAKNIESSLTRENVSIVADTRGAHSEHNKSTDNFTNTANTRGTLSENVETIKQNTSSLSRTKRNNAPCLTSRHQALCPWTYRYNYNATRDPRRIQEAVCESDRVLPGQSPWLECRTQHMAVKVHIRGCARSHNNECSEWIMVPVGCFAAYRCLIPAR